MALTKFPSYLIYLLTEHNIFNSNVCYLYKIQLYGRDTALRVNRIEEFSVWNIQQP